MNLIIVIISAFRFKINRKIKLKWHLKDLLVISVATIYIVDDRMMALWSLLLVLATLASVELRSETREKVTLSKVDSTTMPGIAPIGKETALVNK